MAQVGNSGVANQANTSDGYADGVGAMNVPTTDGAGENVGDGGVVNLYDGVLPSTRFYIADETDPGYVLQENDDKIILEAS
jgi:hypothetical protein